MSKTNRWHIVGLVAWGIGCGQKNVPGVYASVADSLCFIHWTTKCLHGTKYIDQYYYDKCDKWMEEEKSKLEIEAKTDSKAADYLKKAKELEKKCNFSLSIQRFKLG